MRTQSCTGDQIGFMKVISGDSYMARVFIDPVNRRISVKGCQGPDLQGLARELIDIAKSHQLSKVIFYCLDNAAPYLDAAGYILEGRIPGFFRGREAFCHSYFVDPGRGQSPYLEQEEQILDQLGQNKKKVLPPLPEGYSVRPVMAGDVEALVQLYRTVFSSYPSPLFDPAYVKRVMESHVYFLAVFYEERPVSAASAEIDHNNFNAEMTDCATLDGHRGRGLLTVLLDLIEKEMWKLNMGVVYSLSRAGSFGMNAALHKMGYAFKGKFINNCHIGGRFENMNLWVKHEKDG